MSKDPADGEFFDGSNVSGNSSRSSKIKKDTQNSFLLC